MPLLKKGAKTLGREALKTGLNIAGDVVQGRNIKIPDILFRLGVCNNPGFILERILFVFYSEVSPPLVLFRMAL
jgi:hypothetical protein